MKGNGGQKNGIFAPGCKNRGGGGENWEVVGAEVDVEVEELADWDVADADVPLSVVPAATEVPPTGPEVKEKYIQTGLIQSNHRSNPYFKNIQKSHICNVTKFLLQHRTSQNQNRMVHKNNNIKNSALKKISHCIKVMILTF
jgi:hypothetical protein